MSIDEQVAFSQGFIHDANTAHVVWSCEVIRQVCGSVCRLVPRGVDTRHFGNNFIITAFKRTPTSFPRHKCAGTTKLLVFER